MLSKSLQERVCMSSQCATILHSKGNKNMTTTMLAGDRLRRHLISLKLLVLSQLRHVTRNQISNSLQRVGWYSCKPWRSLLNTSMTKCLPGPLILEVQHGHHITRPGSGGNDQV